MKPWHWWRTVFFLIPAISLYTIVLGTISVLSTLFDRSGDFGHACARAWSRLIAKASLGRIPFMGWHLQRTGHVLVDRSRPGASTVKKMARLVAEGHSLI